MLGSNLSAFVSDYTDGVTVEPLRSLFSYTSVSP